MFDKVAQRYSVKKLLVWLSQVLSKAVRGVAAGTDDKDTQDYILQSAKQVMEQSVSLIREAKNAVETPNQPNKQLKLAQVGRVVLSCCRHSSVKMSCMMMYICILLDYEMFSQDIICTIRRIV